MKNKIKFLILFLLIIITTGCSGNYNLKINADLSVDENLELTIDNENDAYEKTLKIFEDNKIKRDNYDVNINSNEVTITYKDKFDSIEDYILNSKVYPQLFSKIQYNKTSKYIDLYTNEDLKIKNGYNEENGSNLTDLDVIQVNIENPFNIISSNEDIVNNHIYTWSIKKNEGQKNIHMQFKPNFNKFPIRPVIVGLLIIIVSIFLIYNLIKRYRNSQRI